MRGGAANLQADQFGPRPFCLTRFKRGLPDKVLVHLHKPIQPRLERVELSDQVGFPMKIPLFHPH